jgi:uncharacterized lipoprotein NlpE involved in copper resistance
MSPVRVLAAALGFLLAGAGCRSAAPVIDAADSAVPAIAAIFTGTLPCADCSGIRTDITLFTVTPGRRSEGSFSLVEHYLGTRTGDRAFRRQGRWVTLRGTTSDPAATVYQLTAEDGSRVVNLRRIDDDAVRLLGDDRSELAADLRHTLRRPGPSLLGGYRQVDASMPDVREAADYAVSEHAARTGTTLSMRHVFWAASQAVAGVRYRLCIETTSAGARNVVTAVVFRTLDQQLSLSDWIEGCEPIPSP